MLFKLKVIFALLLLAGAGAVIGNYTMNNQEIPFESVCKKGNARYTPLCENVGKRAYSLETMAAVNVKDYGPILGVAWRPRGSTITAPGQEIRASQQNAYYYIIGSDESDYVYLRLANEVNPR